MNKVYDLIAICKDLKSKVSEKRYNHCINVGNMAKKLAKIYGVDEKKAYIAGILHDICKEFSYKEQLEIIEGIEFRPPEYCKKYHKVFHGWVGSIYARNYLQITDCDVLNAIRYHTTGRKDMSTLEKIIYNADCVSIERRFDGVEYFRRIAQSDLNVVIIHKLSEAMRNSLKKQYILIRDSFEAYNDLVGNYII